MNIKNMLLNNVSPAALMIGAWSVLTQPLPKRVLIASALQLGLDEE